MRRRLFGTILVLASCGDDGTGELARDGAVDAGQADASLDGAKSSMPSMDAAPNSDAASPDAAPADASLVDARSEGCVASGDAKLELRAVRVKKSGGGAPTKGATLEVEVDLENTGSGANVKLTPLLTSDRFNDFEQVPLGSSSALVCPGGVTTMVVSGGPFLSKGDKQYALGSGDYTVRFGLGDQPERTRIGQGTDFTIAKSPALLVPVVYDAKYLTGISDNPFKTPEAFLEASFKRPNEIFTPSGNDPDGAGSYQSFPDGFDQMEKVEHHFKSFPGFPGEKTTDQGWCEDATAYAKQTLGLASDWNTQAANKHGFDYLIALTPDMGGGVACGWLDVQVSSFINRDVDRQQIIAVHETGHLFGAPHCDDVGNGSGGSLQGYVMCSGEKHEHYPEQLVWHKTSTDQMRSHWD